MYVTSILVQWLAILVQWLSINYTPCFAFPRIFLLTHFSVSARVASHSAGGGFASSAAQRSAYTRAAASQQPSLIGSGRA